MHHFGVWILMATVQVKMSVFLNPEWAAVGCSCSRAEWCPHRQREERSAEMGGQCHLTRLCTLFITLIYSLQGPINAAFNIRIACQHLNTADIQLISAPVPLRTGNLSNKQNAFRWVTLFVFAALRSEAAPEKKKIRKEALFPQRRPRWQPGC